ncbi:hypothetical protein E2C01_037247 [Portunus trituberculatus]|uniref:Uncharacterized protein n=1 Tax=Portunus trituberculatus TaxID=210409 RepID=A0A5B7FDH3_PORTR|nr:hypothetical protein [Portunus trituberculatus]
MPRLRVASDSEVAALIWNVAVTLPGREVTHLSTLAFLNTSSLREGAQELCRYFAFLPRTLKTGYAPSARVPGECPVVSAPPYKLVPQVVVVVVVVSAPPQLSPGRVGAACWFTRPTGHRCSSGRPDTRHQLSCLPAAVSCLCPTCYHEAITSMNRPWTRRMLQGEGRGAVSSAMREPRAKGRG